MEDPAARKERLRALKQAAELSQAGKAEEVENKAEDEEKPVLKFRNYAVKDQKHIEHQQIPAAQPPPLEKPVVESKPEDATEEELLANVAPKKANWDLKRDLQPKLDRLERRTQRAIVDIMRDQEMAQAQEDGVMD